MLRGAENWRVREGAASAPLPKTLGLCLEPLSLIGAGSREEKWEGRENRLSFQSLPWARPLTMSAEPWGSHNTLEDTPAPGPASFSLLLLFLHLSARPQRTEDRQALIPLPPGPPIRSCLNSVMAQLLISMVTLNKPLGPSQTERSREGHLAAKPFKQMKDPGTASPTLTCFCNFSLCRSHCPQMMGEEMEAQRGEVTHQGHTARNSLVVSPHLHPGPSSQKKFVAWILYPGSPAPPPSPPTHTPFTDKEIEYEDTNPPA